MMKIVKNKREEWLHRKKVLDHHSVQLREQNCLWFHSINIKRVSGQVFKTVNICVRQAQDLTQVSVDKSCFSIRTIGVTAQTPLLPQFSYRGQFDATALALNMWAWDVRNSFILYLIWLALPAAVCKRKRYWHSFWLFAVGRQAESSRGLESHGVDGEGEWYWREQSSESEQ